MTVCGSTMWGSVSTAVAHVPYRSDQPNKMRTRLMYLSHHMDNAFESQRACKLLSGGCEFGFPSPSALVLHQVMRRRLAYWNCGAAGKAATGRPNARVLTQAFAPTDCMLLTDDNATHAEEKVQMLVGAGATMLQRLLTCLRVSLQCKVVLRINRRRLLSTENLCGARDKVGQITDLPSERATQYLIVDKPAVTHILHKSDKQKVRRVSEQALLPTRLVMVVIGVAQLKFRPALLCLA
ncbi:hypothetical protein Efla_004124 [Eimeria flavescens]